MGVLAAPAPRIRRAVPTACVPLAGLAGIRWIAVLTGAAGLGGQVGWSRLAGAAVGATFASTALTLSGAMLGLAVGAALAPRRVRDRGARATLASILVACASAAALVPLLLLLVGQLHGHASLRMILTAGLLILGHVPFGAVLPALAAGRGRDGELFALGALGGVLGALGVGGFLAAHLPCDRIGWMLGGLLLALLALLRPRPDAAEARVLDAPRPVPGGAVATAFALGFLGLSAEFVWTRLLGFYWEASPECFAWVTASHVAGLAFGSWSASRLARVFLGPALGLSSLLLAAAVVFSPESLHAYSSAARLGTAAALIGLPAAAFGASFGMLLRRTPGSLGLLSAANAAGSALAPLALWVSSEWIPWPPRALLVVAGGYAFLGLAHLRSRRSWAALPIAVALAWVAWSRVPPTPSTEPYSRRPATGDFDATVLPYVRGNLEATVAVTRETAVGVDMLWIDRGLQGDSSALGRLIPTRLGRLPTQILDRPPRRALAIGLGTGLTLSGMVDGGARNVDVAELVPAVIDANRTILAPLNGGVLERPGVRIFHADGRTMLADAPEPYDLIVADMTFPSVAGAGMLFSREFYATARRRLAPDGLFVHWVPCLQLDPADFSSVVAAFLESFPDGTAWIGSLLPGRIILGLAGGARPDRLPGSTASWMALGPAELRTLAGGRRPLTDADAGLEYRSSRPDRPFGEDHLRTVMSLMRAGPSPAREAWLWFAEGALAERAGDLARAHGCYRQAVRASPETDAGFFLEQIRFDDHFRRASEAIQERAALGHLRDAASHPHLVRGNLCLGDTLAALGRVDQAAEEFERAVAKAPRSADAHMKLALLAWRSGDFPRARSAFRAACELRPDRPALYVRFEREVIEKR